MKFVLAAALIAIAGWWFFGQAARDVPETPSTAMEEDADGGVAAPEVAATATYTMVDVATHKDAADCWTVVRKAVYDVTAFIDKHPGGDKNILKLCGIDGTSAFEGKHGGQEKPEAVLAGFMIGTLEH